MNKRLFNVQEAKIQASILLKSLGSPETTLRAAKRFQQLPEFASIEIQPKEVKYKHALAVIALENGFASWTDLKIQTHLIISGYLNKWFARYEEAKIIQHKQGGFLFPYKNQFFICEADYIERLGLNPTDPDWQAIHCDWVNPADKKAWQRLYKKITRNIK